MLKVIKPPDYKSPTLFLAGSISGAKDWQSEFISLLEKENLDLTVFNPRRDTFDTSCKQMTVEQIEWEHHHLLLADAIVFYFSNETVAPITLFELGKFVYTDRPLMIGMHPDYPRRLDVEVQLRLVSQDMSLPPISYCLQDLALQVRKYFRGA